MKVELVESELLVLVLELILEFGDVSVQVLYLLLERVDFNRVGGEFLFVALNFRMEIFYGN